MPGQIFISYSRVNTEFVTRLINDLTRQGFNVWMDQRDIGAGQRWDSLIQDALETCGLFIIILSPYSVESENVLDELSYAINAHKRIIPILLENCAIPYRIARIQFVNFTEDYQTGFQHLISEIKQTSPRRPITVKKKKESPRSIFWLIGAAFALLCCFALGVGMYMVYPYYFPADKPEVVTITPNRENTISTTPPPHIITDAPTPTLVPPHAPEIDNTFGVQLYEERQQLIMLQPGEQHTLHIMEIWKAPEGAEPNCASGFMALTWMVREPYPNGGEDLQLRRPVRQGGGTSEIIAEGSQGAIAVGYCDEIQLFNNSLVGYRVEIRYASGLYP